MPHFSPQEAAVAAPTAPQDVPIVKVPPTSPFDSAHTGASGPAPPQPPLPRVPSRLLNRPDSSGSPLQWRLDDHEIATNSTLNALVAIKECDGCARSPLQFRPFLHRSDPFYPSFLTTESWPVWRPWDPAAAACPSPTAATCGF